MPKTVILGTARTPFGKLGGALSTLDATDLGGHAIAAALERAEVAPDQVQHVVIGQVLQAGQGQIPSRQAQIKGGIPKEVSSETVNKVCASGIRSAGIIDQAIRAGDLEVGVAGGMESMSNAPYLLKNARFGYRMGDAKMLDAMVHDGLTNPFTGKHMAAEATEVGDELEITRPDLDKFALRSHERAIEATDDGRLPEEIVAVTISRRRATPSSRSTRPRAATPRSRALAKLKPHLRQGRHAHGRQLAGRQRRRRRARARQRRVGRDERPDVLATIVAQAAVADDFPYLARTPANATKLALEKAGLTSTTSTCSRSTRRSPRSRSTRCACSASTRRRSTSTAARSRSVTRSAPRRPHPRLAGARAASPRRRARRGGDLLRRRPGRRVILEVNGS